VARILLVDDDPDQIEIRQMILEREGHPVIAAATVEEAAGACRDSVLDVVLMDLAIPDPADGQRLIRELRAARPELPIYVLSGWTSHFERCTERKMVQQVLQKPVKTELLLNLLRTVFALALLVLAPTVKADEITAHAPILFGRPDTAGGTSDEPLLMYCERKQDSGNTILEYTVVFSNEDGGTSTRALMARWGRTTDIEHVYRVMLAPGGKVLSEVIQTRDHKDVKFEGSYEGLRPQLAVITKNNMVGPGNNGRRFELAPKLVDLSGASREQVMDDHPWIYRRTSEELAAEGKVRPFGAVDGEKISDPRNYVYIEAKVSNRDSRWAAAVRLRGSPIWRQSHLGRPDYAIERSGWARTSVELPPGTPAEAVAEIGFECLVEGKATAGECRVEAVRKVFLLGGNYEPRPPIWSLDRTVAVESGKMASFALHGN
jgi:CheY-like chemotaxis protein